MSGAYQIIYLREGKRDGIKVHSSMNPRKDASRCLEAPVLLEVLKGLKPLKLSFPPHLYTSLKSLLSPQCGEKLLFHIETENQLEKATSSHFVLAWVKLEEETWRPWTAFHHAVNWFSAPSSTLGKFSKPRLTSDHTLECDGVDYFVHKSEITRLYREK